MTEEKTQPSPFSLFVVEDTEAGCTFAYLAPTDDPENEDARIMLCTAFSPLVHPKICPEGHKAHIAFVEALANEFHKALLGGPVGHVSHCIVDTNGKPIDDEGKPVTLN